ncbi:MAG: response regulator transcription factor [Magnetococcales bacterium]|nr:response regulator transcription factor [Magnetococcales bacterium]
MVLTGFAVFIVEDDQSVRDALGLLLGLHGYSVALYESAEDFLAALQPGLRGCILVDIRMPGMNGLVLQQRLVEAGCTLPVIIMTAYGSVETARIAFRSHAIDFLEKPIDSDKLLNAIQEAFLLQENQHNTVRQMNQYGTLLATLTPREKEVMELVVTGLHNRDIASLLGISARTVEVHKARMMEKLAVASIPDLVRLSMSAARTN